MNVVEVETHYAEIFVAGEIADARRICREFCMKIGLCVTLEPVDFTNYPRFPASPDELIVKASALAHELMAGLCQWSALVRTAQRTVWFTTRPAS